MALVHRDSTKVSLGYFSVLYGSDVTSTLD